MKEKYQFSTLEDIKQYSKHFADERGWQQYQTPKNIAMALSVECAELVEHFQWLTADESFELDAVKKKAIGEEVSDVLFYLMRIVDILDIDVFQAASKKAALNEEKYPLTSTKIIET